MASFIMVEWSTLFFHNVVFMAIVSFLQLLDKLHMDDRHSEKPLRVPVLDRYNDRGTMVLGKVEQVRRYGRLLIM